MTLLFSVVYNCIQNERTASTTSKQITSRFDWNPLRLVTANLKGFTKTMVAQVQETKYYLSEQDRSLIARIVNASDFPDKVGDHNVITIRLEDGVVWVRLSRCWVAFDAVWFRQQVKALKPQFKVEKTKPTKQPKSVEIVDLSNWKWDSNKNICWKVVTYRVTGDTGNTHTVTIDTRGEVSCSCKGHLYHGHCYHSSAAMKDWRDFQDWSDEKNSDDLAREQLPF